MPSLNFTIERNHMRIHKILRSRDNKTIKFIQATSDNFLIETVYVDYWNKHIICYSTQVGCDNGCKFCYCGIARNFKRDLSGHEIFRQISNVIDKVKPTPKKPIVFSAMGMGEPLNNFEGYIHSLLSLNYEYPGNKYALATSGSRVQGIYDLANRVKGVISPKLTISLHAPTAPLRKQLIPSQQSLSDLMKASVYYSDTIAPVEYNITLIHNRNDSDEVANQMAKLLKAYCDAPSVKVNKFNNVKGLWFRGSSVDRIKSYIETLVSYGIDVEYYETDGSDINAACGQLASQSNISLPL